MRKITLLVLLTCILNGYSQSLVFTHNGKVLDNNANITESAIDEMNAIPAHAFVKNQSASAIEATLTLTVLEEPIGAQVVGFCGWGSDQCMPVAFGNPYSRTTIINAGQELDPVIEAMEVVEENTLVKTQYKLTYSEQEIILNVTFAAGTSDIKDINLNNSLKINTGNNITEIEYNFDRNTNRQIVIYNLTGKQICSRSLTEKQGSLSLNNISKGIYLCSIQENGNIVNTQKFIVH